jgi:hypothetical protein
MTTANAFSSEPRADKIRRLCSMAGRPQDAEMHLASDRSTGEIAVALIHAAAGVKPDGAEDFDGTLRSERTVRSSQDEADRRARVRNGGK